MWFVFDFLTIKILCVFGSRQLLMLEIQAFQCKSVWVFQAPTLLALHLRWSPFGIHTTIILTLNEVDVCLITETGAFWHLLGSVSTLFFSSCSLNQHTKPTTTLRRKKQNFYCGKTCRFKKIKSFLSHLMKANTIPSANKPHFIHLWFSPYQLKFALIHSI